MRRRRIAEGGMRGRENGRESERANAARGQGGFLAGADFAGRARARRVEAANESSRERSERAEISCRGKTRSYLGSIARRPDLTVVAGSGESSVATLVRIVAATVTCG